MKFFKFNFRIIIGFIIGVVLASSITVYAYSYIASEIKYTDNKTVEQALNELYENNKISTFYFLVFAGSNNGFYYSNYQNYKYFRITETESGTSNSISLIKYNWTNNGETTSLSLNTKYQITADNEQIVIQPNTGYRNIKIEFFKE